MTLVEHGPVLAVEHLGGTLLVVVACYLVMNSLAGQVLVGLEFVVLRAADGDVHPWRPSIAAIRIAAAITSRRSIVEPGSKVTSSL